jgi:hypothetical protein
MIRYLNAFAYTFFSGRYSKVNNDAQSIVVDEYANGNSNGGSDQ